MSHSSCSGASCSFSRSFQGFSLSGTTLTDGRLLEQVELVWAIDEKAQRVAVNLSESNSKIQLETVVGRNEQERGAEEALKSELALPGATSSAARKSGALGIVVVCVCAALTLLVVALYMRVIKKRSNRGETPVHLVEV